MPAGLSIMRIPFILTVAAVYDRRRSRICYTGGGHRPPLQVLFGFDLFQKLFDADVFFDVFVVIERKFRNAPEVVQAFAERAPNEVGGGPQAFQSFLALSGVAEDGYEDARVRQIRRNSSASHRGESDAGILNFAFN